MLGPLMLVLMMSAAATGPAGQTGDGPAAETGHCTGLVGGNNFFALDLYGTLAETEKGNIFYSPYSVSTALAMTWSGARGSTAREMAEVLHLDEDGRNPDTSFAALGQALAEILDKGDVSLTTANSIWPRKGMPLLDSYASRLRRCYGVSVTPLDYGKEPEAARRTINQWVEARTREKIRELIPPGSIDPATVIVLVNAIHFKGNWAESFDPALTRPGSFTLADGTVKAVPMMNRSGRYRVGGDEGVEVLELPYRGGDLSMVVILPRKDGGLAALERELTPLRLFDLLYGLHEETVSVALPKFTFRWGTTDLVPALKALGMKEAFGAGADFSGMTGSKGFFISLVLHQAFIEVNEEGSEAAAATAVIAKRGMPRQVRVDRPFLFLIRDRTTDSILFFGRVMDPTAS